MDVSLLIACLSLLIGALALGWQVAAWALDGRRVRVVLLHGASGMAGAAVGKVGRNGRPVDLSQVRAEGFTGEEVIGISVTNIGRSPVRVDRYSVELTRGGMSFSPIGDAVGPELPFRLPPGESETWYARHSDALRLLHSMRSIGRAPSRTVRMSVQLGTGDIRRTRRVLEIS